MKHCVAAIVLGFAFASALPADGPRLRAGPSVDFSHGDLKVAAGGRFLAHADGTPFFYLGDTAWEIFHRLTIAEAEKYLENRRAKGYTVIQSVALAEFDGLTAPNRQGHLPLIDNDPTKPNEAYFKDVDAVVEIAKKKGIYIGLLPTWGDKVNKKWGKGPEIFTPENAKVYGQWLGTRYKDQPNIIWILGGDRPVENEKHREVWRAMAAGLGAGDGGKHLIGYHPQGGQSSAKYYPDEAWLAFHMIQSGHAVKDGANYEMIAKDYAFKPTKPVFDGEPRYEDHPVRRNGKGQYFNDYDTRQAAYWSVFAGSFGHTYGSHSIWSMHSKELPAPGNLGKEMLITWDVAMDRPGNWAMMHLRRLMESRPMLSRVPDQELIAGGQGEGADHVQATRGEGYAMLYLPTGKAVTVRMGTISGAKARAWWFDPRTGEAKAIGEFENKGTREFSPGGETGRGWDMVLVIDDAARGWGAPGAGDQGKR